jgi:UDP-N-acetylmuramoyl-L-alanyl-D-glutamate--2,6-diaminopimelate ligase
MEKLKRLLKDLPPIDVIGSKEIEITGIASNSKLVAPGSLFIARRGVAFDGNRFIPEAIASGAVALLSDVFDPSLAVTQLITPDVTAMEALLAAAFWQYPSKELTLVAITGTSGKTTTSYIVHHLFSHFGIRAGLIGTVAYIVGTRRYEALNTTPDVVTNHRLLGEIVKGGDAACVMEVSSHALTQQRVAGIGFDTAIFTNLTHEHLDYHKTMEAYAQAKNILFRSLGSEGKKDPLAILNAQDPWTAHISQGTKAQVVTYAIDASADVIASHIVLGPYSTAFDMSYAGQTTAVMSPLVGRYNVANALAAAASFLARGYPLKEVAAGLSTVNTPPGRLERVQNALGLAIYVDYAHKEDALRKVLPALRESTKGKLITVFGCGGDRDREKRPLMARAVEELSDIAIVTTDNPRSEDPQSIINEICKGFSSSNYIVIPDRKEAIHKAVHMATPEDVILIAGKGHEKYQIFAHGTVPFDDCQIAADCCATLKTLSVDENLAFLTRGS